MLYGSIGIFTIFKGFVLYICSIAIASWWSARVRIGMYRLLWECYWVARAVSATAAVVGPGGGGGGSTDWVGV